MAIRVVANKDFSELDAYFNEYGKRNEMIMCDQMLEELMIQYVTGKSL